MSARIALFLALSAGVFAVACATTDAARFVNPETGDLVPVATLTRGEDGVVRDQHGHVVREARFVRSTSAVSESGPPDDIFCTRERRVGTSFRRTVCMTRRDVIIARQQAEESIMGIMKPDTAPGPGGRSF